MQEPRQEEEPNNRESPTIQVAGGLIAGYQPRCRCRCSYYYATQLQMSSVTASDVLSDRCCRDVQLTFITE